VPEIVRAAVEAQPGTRFDRCHFKSYGASSLDFETVYFMLDPDFNRFMDVQQSINLELFDRFAEEGIEFAFPTRTLFVRSSEREPAHAR
jgi:small-conductance mechanosensitive channel